MFTEYFRKQAVGLEKALRKKLEKRGVHLPAKERDINVYQDFFTFLKEHLPADYSLATGKVRNKKHLLNRNCDLLVYRKWCERYLDLTGGYVLADSLHAFMTLEADLTAPALQTHCSLTRALKSLYAGEIDPDDGSIIPVYSVLFAYASERSLADIRDQLMQLSEEKEIPGNLEADLICVLDRGILIKDWERAGRFKVVETETDTLMWFYIILLEYIDREGRFQWNLRDYIKNTREYGEA